MFTGEYMDRSVVHLATAGGGPDF